MRKGTREVRRKKRKRKDKREGREIEFKKCDTLGICMHRICLVQKNIQKYCYL